MKFFKEMPWSRSTIFEGGIIEGGQPKDYVWSKRTTTYHTKEKFVSLYQYTGRYGRVAGEYWMKEDFTIWQIPFRTNDEFAMDKATRLEKDKSIEVLQSAKSNGHAPDWDHFLDETIEKIL
ncbi:MAG: hypothetical protein V1804_03950 [Patescibacteria group bacterium]